MIDESAHRQVCDALRRAIAGRDAARADLLRLARLVDSGDLDGARAMARGILEGEGDS